MFAQLYTERLPRLGERFAEQDAWNRVEQRREADRQDAQSPSHFPPHETPLEQTDRYIRASTITGNRDDAYRLMFEEDVRAWLKACPNYDAEQITQRIMDRGYYCRWGYMWGLRIAEILIDEPTAGPWECPECHQTVDGEHKRCPRDGWDREWFDEEAPNDDSGHGLH
jgi:hypothetical protein